MATSSTEEKSSQAEVKAQQASSSSNSDDKTDISQDIDPENEVQGIKLILIHTAICLCTFLVGLDFNLIATAVPVITTQFHSIGDVGWYGASFMLSMCASQPLAGKTYTLFPKKAAYLVYLFVFEVGSLVCALAPSSPALIVGRAVAGLGASGIFAGGFALLTTIIPLHKRAIWTGIMGSTFAVASIVGPVLAGALTQHVTWRWCFYINLPIGGAGAAFIVLLVRLKTAPIEVAHLLDKLSRLDGLGFLLFAAAITMLLLALNWGGASYAWSSSMVIGLIVGAGLTMVLFVAWQLYLERASNDPDKPLIPPRLFRINRNPTLLCAAAFFVQGPFQLIIYWLPIWFQAVLGSSPTQSGINYLPTVVADVVAAFVGSGLVMQLGWWNPFLLLAEACVCLGGGLLSTIYPDVAGARWIGFQILGGVGYSLSGNLSHIAMQSSLPQDLVPLGSSTLLAIISTSCAIYMAIGQAVFQTRLLDNLAHVVPEETIHRVISVGATGMRSVVDPADLPAVVEEYSKSITQVFYISAASPIFSFFFIAGCMWISTKSKQMSQKKSGAETEEKEVV